MQLKKQRDFVQLVPDGSDTTIMPVIGFRVVTRSQLDLLFNEGWELSEVIPTQGATLMVIDRTPLIIPPYGI